MYKILITVMLLHWIHNATVHEHDGYKGFDIKVTELGSGIFNSEQIAPAMLQF
jgi:hypothetical protein